MNVKKIVGKYHRSLVINPIVAGSLAMLVLSVNTILPAIVSLFSEQTALRMEESVELISVYGVALGTLFVFIVLSEHYSLLTCLLTCNLGARIKNDTIHE